MSLAYYLSVVSEDGDPKGEDLQQDSTSIENDDVSKNKQEKGL